MLRFIDLTGQKFGRLTVIRLGGRQNGRIHWLCRCDCGNEVNVAANHLKNNHTKSCGCHKRDAVSKRKLHELKGKKFGRLTVVRRSKSIKGHTMWECVCECGKIAIVDGGHLRDGHTQSCGCFHDEGRKPVHGMANTRLFRIWLGIRNRCNRPTINRYCDYGGRGITVCDEWNNDFVKFYEWSMANGYRNDLWIERIDNNGNYEPDNCRWATPMEQASNKRNNRYVAINGVTKTVTEWARETGINRETVTQRIRLGHTGESLIRPTRKGNYGKKNTCPRIEQG